MISWTKAIGFSVIVGCLVSGMLLLVGFIAVSQGMILNPLGQTNVVLSRDFTYHGSLQLNREPADGLYDFEV